MVRYLVITSTNMSKENPFDPPGTPAQETPVTPEQEKHALQERIKSLDLMTWEGREELMKILKSKGHNNAKFDSETAEWNIDDEGTPILGRTNKSLGYLCSLLKYATEGNVYLSKRDGKFALLDALGDNEAFLGQKINRDMLGYLLATDKDFIEFDGVLQNQLICILRALADSRSILYSEVFKYGFDQAEDPWDSFDLIYTPTTIDCEELFFKLLQKRVNKEQVDKAIESDTERSTEPLLEQAQKLAKKVSLSVPSDAAVIQQKNIELLVKIQETIKELYVALDAAR